MSSSMGQFFIELLNLIIKGFGVVLQGLIALFPDSPFRTAPTVPGSVNLGYVTWLIDFPTMLGHLALLLAAVITYYAIRVVAQSPHP